MQNRPVWPSQLRAVRVYRCSCECCMEPRFLPKLSARICVGSGSSSHICSSGPVGVENVAFSFIFASQQLPADGNQLHGSCLPEVAAIVLRHSTRRSSKFGAPVGILCLVCVPCSEHGRGCTAPATGCSSSERPLLPRKGAQTKKKWSIRSYMCLHYPRSVLCFKQERCTALQDLQYSTRAQFGNWSAVWHGNLAASEADPNSAAAQAWRDGGPQSWRFSAEFRHPGHLSSGIDFLPIGIPF